MFENVRLKLPNPLDGLFPSLPRVAGQTHSARRTLQPRLPKIPFFMLIEANPRGYYGDCLHHGAIVLYRTFGRTPGLTPVIPHSSDRAEPQRIIHDERYRDVITSIS